MLQTGIASVSLSKHREGERERDGGMLQLAAGAEGAVGTLRCAQGHPRGDPSVTYTPGVRGGSAGQTEIFL